MELYRRHIINRLLFFRVLLVILVLIGADAFYRDFTLIGYGAILLIFFIAWIRVTGLHIYHDHVSIERYYFFGCLRVRWNSDKNDKNSVHLVRRFEDLALTPTDTLADIIIPFFPAEAKFQGVVISYKMKSGIMRRVQVAVKDHEYNILLSRFPVNNVIPLL